MRIIAAIGLMGAVLFANAATPAERRPTVERRSEVVLAGAPDRGIFDPSIAADGSRLYITVSGVSSTSAGSSLGDNAVGTYLALSTDQGRTWQLVGNNPINADMYVSLKQFPSPHRGRWQSEVASLVFDPYAPPASRWRFFWHQYLNVNGDRKFENGWLAYKEAKTPEQLASARPVELFTALGYNAANDQSGGNTKPPIPGPAVIRIQDLHRDLSKCAAVSEPGALAASDALYLAMLCVQGSFFGLFGVSNQIVLLKCPQPCEATKSAAWSYAGTVLSQKDAEALKLRKFSAANLYTHGGRTYIVVSPVGTVPGEGAYKGCAVFQFKDLATGLVERDEAGRPRLEALVALEKESFNGACAFLPEGPYTGLMIGQVDFGMRQGEAEPTFHIYRTEGAR